MYHPPSKRKQIAQRIIVYTLMTISTAVLVAILAFVLLGYKFNKADGRIEQGGLVQFDTRSGNAALAIDGASFGARTPAKTTLLAGPHFIAMTLKGYDTWQKSIDVQAGSVLWLTYPRLVPQELTPSTVANFSTVVTSTAVSPDQKWMALKDGAATPIIRLANLSKDPVTVTSLTLPASSLTAPKTKAKQTFTIDSWDSSSRYLLVKHTYDTNETEWLVVDTQDVKATKNLTVLLAVNASGVKFSSDNSQVLYVLVDHALRKINLGDKTLSAPLVRDVADFSIYNHSTITYVTQLASDTKQRSVGYYDDGASKPRTVRSYSDNGKVPLHFAIGKYYGETYVAIAYAGTVDILKGDLPRSDSSDTSSLKTVATMTIPSGVNYLSIRTDGRFIVAQHGSAYSVYDLELGKATTTQLKSDHAPKKELHWIDGYYIVDDQTGTARIYEFDGANQHDIMSVVPGLNVTLSPNGKYMYGVSKDKKGAYHLSRVQMILG